MAEPYIGEVRIFANTYVPVGWMRCDGQILNISEQSALYSIIATRYGGNGQTNFGLPNLNGRVPLGSGYGPGLTPRNLGEMSGISSYELKNTEIPSHNHTITNVHVDASEQPNPDPESYLGKMNQSGIYASTDDNLTSMSQEAISVAGGSQEHENTQPYLTLQFCIAIEGTYPSRN